MEATFRGNPQLYWLIQIWNILGPEILKPLLEEIMKLKYTPVVMVTTYTERTISINRKPTFRGNILAIVHSSSNGFSMY